MNILKWIILAVVIFTIFGGIRAVLMLKKLSKEERQKALNYRFFLIIGAIMTPFGLLLMLIAILENYTLWHTTLVIIMGLVYLVIGLGIKSKRIQ